MIQLFPRPTACEWCNREHPQAQLCHARPGLSRRSFLFLAGSAAAVALVAPNLLIQPADGPMLFPLEWGPNTSLVDAILKEHYLPAIVAHLNGENTLMQFIAMSPAEQAAHDRRYRNGVTQRRIARGLRRASARRAA